MAVTPYPEGHSRGCWPMGRCMRVSSGQAQAPVIVPEGRGRLIIIGADEEVQMEDILQGRPGSRKEQDAPKRGTRYFMAVRQQLMGLFLTPCWWQT